MKVVTALLPNISRWVPQGHGWFTLWCVVVAVGMEIFGRMAATGDYHDLLAAIILFCAGTFAIVRQKNEPHPALARFGEWLIGIERALVSLKHEIGLDYRGDPPIGQRTPRKLWAIPVFFLILACVFAAIWRMNPDGWRMSPDAWGGYATYFPYTLYVMGLSLLWTVLGVIVAVGVYIPMRAFEPAIERLAPGSWSAAIAIYVLTGLFLSFTVPAIWPLSFAGLLLLASIAGYLLPHESAPALLWRSRSNRMISSVPLPRVAAFVSGTASIAVMAVIVAAAGQALFIRPEGEGSMPVTIWFGSLAAWFVPGLVMVVVIAHWSLRTNDPARRTPGTLFLANRVSAADRDRVRQFAVDWNWSFATGVERETEFVAIELVTPDRSEAREFEPTWPLKVSLADLEDPIVKDRLARRDELQLRRLSFRGFAKLFKKTSKGSTGDGVLFAPQWWFIDGLAREADPAESDDDDDSLQTIRRVGPGFDRVLPPRARQHWHAVLRAVKIDLIFIEDGIKAKAVEKVLRQLLAIYDRSHGKRQAEDIHFNGVPKVKCMIHEYGLDKPFETSGDYPEPKFLDLTRARVLHIYKDRGDQSELNDIPFDYSWEPSPLMLA